MKYCKRCLLNSEYRNIEFDKKGLCNYCRTYDNFRDRLTDFDFSVNLLKERFDLIRGKYDYDCLAGISGGKDSSYLVYLLKNKYGLKILTFTFDNGFLTDYAKENIELVVKKLGVEHFFYKPDWDRYKDLYRQSVLRFGYPCPVCAFSLYAFMNKAAFEKRIPLCIHGRSPAQMFKEFLRESIDPFLPFIKNNLSSYNIENNKQTALYALRRLKYLFSKVIKDKLLRQEFYNDFFPDMEKYKRSGLIPEFLGYFLYERYDEKKIIDVLQLQTGWQRPSHTEALSHSDCLVHDAAMYLYNKVLGYSLLSLELSVMIREGKITREEARSRLGKEECLWEMPRESMDILCERCNISKDSIGKIIYGARRRHKLIKLGLKIRNIINRPKQSVI